jgi:hypothetical protein
MSTDGLDWAALLARVWAIDVLDALVLFPERFAARQRVEWKGVQASEGVGGGAEEEFTDCRLSDGLGETPAYDTYPLARSTTLLRLTRVGLRYVSGRQWPWCEWLHRRLPSG